MGRFVPTNNKLCRKIAALSGLDIKKLVTTGHQRGAYGFASDGRWYYINRETGQHVSCPFGMAHASGASVAVGIDRLPTPEERRQQHIDQLRRALAEAEAREEALK